MLRILKQIFTAGIATSSYPTVVIQPPEGFRGKPVIDFARCTACNKCSDACPTNAISVNSRTEKGDIHEDERTVSINYGNCIFCGECEAACPDAVRLTKEFQLATTSKDDLVTQARYQVNREGVFVLAQTLKQDSTSHESMEKMGTELKERIHTLFRRSLYIREVDTGSCNGCEVEINGLNNPVHDIERFGIKFVASPRHADMLLVTGPVTRNMELALKRVYEATPDPKLVVAVGACAIGGGIFGKSYASCGGVDTTVPVDVYIPGCPPRPQALLHGILLAVGRYSGKSATNPIHSHKGLKANAG
ncbi:MAG: NADH-quinone oxidoreductase subunit NuoB [Bacteroidota bacterium]